jgi:hypothetical protein
VTFPLLAGARVRAVKETRLPRPAPSFARARAEKEWRSLSAPAGLLTKPLWQLVRCSARYAGTCWRSRPTTRNNRGMTANGGRRQYNEAVRNSFLKEKGIGPEQMTPEQARSFADRVKASSDPRIRQFNMRLYMREFQYWIRRGPGRKE